MEISECEKISLNVCYWRRAQFLRPTLQRITSHLIRALQHPS